MQLAALVDRGIGHMGKYCNRLGWKRSGKCWMNIFIVLDPRADYDP
jgi:hypothetical protein